MPADEFRVSEESRSELEPFEALPLRDPRRRELFSFLAEALAEPNGVAFEQDEGLRWTWLEHVALAWRLDLVESELDVILVWDPNDDP